MSAYRTLDHHARPIPLAEIALGVPLNGFDEARVQHYADQMERNRPLVPITLTRRADDGRLVVIDGHHRVAAAARCGFLAVPATVISP
jgi:ParB-like chromosome segregation protein Spo0J